MRILDQVRLIAAETLLGWAMSVAPKTNDGLPIIKAVSEYFREAMQSENR